MEDNLLDGAGSGNSKRFICLVLFIILSTIFLITTIIFVALYVNAKNDSESANKDTPVEPIVPEEPIPILYPNPDRFIKVLSRITEVEGAYVKQGKHDFLNSKYFNYIDIYNTKSSGSLILLEKFKTYQQTSEYSCGMAALIMAVYYLDGTILDEKEMGEIAGTNAQDGTPLDGLERAISSLGYEYDSKFNYTNETSPSRNEIEFAKYIKDTLKRNESIIVESNDWGGHYSVIIGYDDMGTEDMADDIIILADPYDTSDHMSDGYTIFNYERYYAQMTVNVYGIEDWYLYFNTIKRKNK